MSKHEPIQEQYREQMRALASALEEVFNGELRGEERTTGFVLLCFPFGDVDRARINYISNADRSDVLLSMKEFIARAEGRITDEEQLQ